MLRFWDTSAFLSLLLEQLATEDLKAILSADDRMALWWGTKVEATSGILRSRRAGEMDDLSVSRLLSKIERLTAGAHEIQPTEEVRNAACRVLRVHVLRSADALQLAAALVWAEHDPSGLGFVCLDKRLREAAQREGFDVLPP